jgi:NADH-ubiquinone oxidoreductase chain 1
MTEHSASIFVFFFLAEYASIVLICVLNSILFLGGYLSIIPIDLSIELLNSLFGGDNYMLETIFTNISSSPLNL